MTTGEGYEYKYQYQLSLEPAVSAGVGQRMTLWVGDRQTADIKGTQTPITKCCSLSASLWVPSKHCIEIDGKM